MVHFHNQDSCSFVQSPLGSDVHVSTFIIFFIFRTTSRRFAWVTPVHQLDLLRPVSSETPAPGLLPAFLGVSQTGEKVAGNREMVTKSLILFCVLGLLQALCWSSHCWSQSDPFLQADRPHAISVL